MKRNLTFSGLRAQILLIVLFSMSLMLIFQGISMGGFIRLNNRRRREYIAAVNENIAASLNTMGENIRSMAVYIASFESFKALYFPNRSAAQDVADTISAAFHTVRFIADYYPIIRDVVVVGLNGLPFSYYMGYGYDFMELMRWDYNFTDPDAVESRFFYFDEKDYFVYVTPIGDTFSSTGITQKIASCIFICDLEYIRNLVDISAGANDVNFSIYDEAGRLIAAGAYEINREPGTAEFVSRAVNMGLTVAASGGPPGLIPRGDEPVRFIRNIFVFSILLLIVITAMVIVLLRTRVARPISDLVHSLSTGIDKPLHTRLKRSNIEEIDRIVEGVNTLLGEIEDYTRKSMASQQKLYEMELRKNEAEIYALQSQINPHFLNNTLQCIRSIAITKGVDEIAAISLSMSELFRYAMNYEDQALVQDEIDIVRHYISITNIRFRGRFVFSFGIAPEIYRCYMFRIMLQPLVENAVRHGVSKRDEGGMVEIAGSMENGEVRFSVIDNGPGFGEGRLAEIRRELAYNFMESREHHRKDGCFGLYNINRRLKLNYGEAYGLEIGSGNGRTLAEIRFPRIV
ncbi:MAG: histidine kinase [Treponema sp.]|jgi:two-component system sensor histidine kinase YesM|nr:histidine kinase [Treponema sp.]